ncbi:hypothetical protein KVT40_005636 [Elsinoe batatas]|uniref:Uncharacterized protein n=1 Tax=Elsinoe batatas TaxID=2601811 RepID=A0A8K0L2Y3_9PEZI|nr:hypothetical protein KVT40_005636 [Elsinoe batatas]
MHGKVEQAVLSPDMKYPVEVVCDHLTGIEAYIYKTIIAAAATEYVAPPRVTETVTYTNTGPTKTISVTQTTTTALYKEYATCIDA